MNVGVKLWLKFVSEILVNERESEVVAEKQGLFLVWSEK